MYWSRNFLIYYYINKNIIFFFSFVFFLGGLRVFLLLWFENYTLQLGEATYKIYQENWNSWRKREGRIRSWFLVNLYGAAAYQLHYQTAQVRGKGKAWFKVFFFFFFGVNFESFPWWVFCVWSVFGLCRLNFEYLSVEFVFLWCQWHRFANFIRCLDELSISIDLFYLILGEFGLVYWLWAVKDFG